MVITAPRALMRGSCSGRFTWAFIRKGAGGTVDVTPALQEKELIEDTAMNQHASEGIRRQEQQEDDQL